MSVWLYDSTDGTSRRLTSGRETEAMAVWSPDGDRIAFGRAAGATPKLYARSIAHTASEALPQAAFQPDRLVCDGRFILYQTTGGSASPVRTSWLRISTAGAKWCQSCIRKPRRWTGYSRPTGR